MYLSTNSKIIHSIPLALLAFCLVSIRTTISVIDGPDEDLYGFPLYWHHAGAVSLSIAVRTLALAIDLLFYLIVFAFLSSKTRLGDMLNSLTLLKKYILWFIACIIVSFFAYFILLFEVYKAQTVSFYPNYMKNIKLIVPTTVIGP
jgi:hypothetical protein